jgi:hypothetical protein
MDELTKAEVGVAMARADLEQSIMNLEEGGKERKALHEVLNSAIACVKESVTHRSNPPSALDTATALKALSTLIPVEFRARGADVAQQTLELAKERLAFDKKCREEDQAEMRRKNEVGGTAGERALDILRAAGLFKQGLDPEEVARIEAAIRRGD